MKIITGITILTILFVACNKNDLGDHSLSGIRFSVEKVSFDTLLGGITSTVQTVKIFNQSSDDIQLYKVELGGGSNSLFALNLHGQPGTIFQNISIPAKDSIYLFVSITPDNPLEDDAFLVKDSIRFFWNSFSKSLELEAYTQPVTIFKNHTLQNDLTLDSNKTYLIQGPFVVPQNMQLEILEGAKIYVYPNSTIEVEGTLKVLGKAQNPVLFSTYRKDQPVSGSWEGIKLLSGNQTHDILYTTIEYAKNAIVFESSELTNNQLNIEGSRIVSSSGVGLKLKNIHLSVRNSEITNNNINLFFRGGGHYSLQNITTATYSSMASLHLNPGISVADNYIEAGNTLTFPIAVEFINCILWGDLAEEILFDKQNSSSVFNINHSIYKSTKENADILYMESLTTDPLFAEIDISRKIFNFKLSSVSPAIDHGIFILADKDITGAERTDGKPDSGCYEYYSSEQ